MENFEIQTNQDKAVIIANTMQMELAQLHGETIEDFITKHASDFRNVIDTHPEFIDIFEKDHEKALEEIGDIIYH